ncbi:MAG: hypothetical protein WB810_08810 [Candidatus Cybelea sp.]
MPDLHMENVFAASPAKVLVVLGKVAKEALLGPNAQLPEAPQEINLGGKPRTVFFLPHPNEHGDKKSLAAHYGNEAVENARRTIAAV